jgi:hypothetical protein
MLKLPAFAHSRPTPINESIYASLEGTKKYSEMDLAINCHYVYFYNTTR